MNQFNRQYPRAAAFPLDIENIGAGNEVTVKLPQGAYLTDVDLNTITAFDSATTTTGTVTDGTTVFVNGVDLKTTGNETAANLPKYYPNGGTLTFSIAETGATATEGAAIGTVEYLIVGGGDEIYG